MVQRIPLSPHQPEPRYRGGRIKDNFSTIHPVHHPVLGVVPPVADVHGDAPEPRLIIR